MPGSPYRIVTLINGTPHYYATEVEHHENGRATTLPFFSGDVSEAKRFNTPAEAVVRRDSFKQMWPRNRFFIESCSGSDALFDDRAADVKQTEAPAVRQNYQADGILIVAGQTSGYYIRFPGSAFESIRGETPDEAYARYREQLALRPILQEYVEKFQTPEMNDAEFAAQIQTAQAEVQRARFGPGRRRPGDR